MTGVHFLCFRLHCNSTRTLIYFCRFSILLQEVVHWCSEDHGTLCKICLGLGFFVFVFLGGFFVLFWGGGVVLFFGVAGLHFRLSFDRNFLSDMKYHKTR